MQLEKTTILLYVTFIVSADALRSPSNMVWQGFHPQWTSRTGMSLSQRPSSVLEVLPAARTRSIVNPSNVYDDDDFTMSRRLLIGSTISATLSGSMGLVTAWLIGTITDDGDRQGWMARADSSSAQRQPLDELLYRILRVREATQQETRLIRNGKFKDVQRANVKLAIKFMVENYRLNDAFIAAGTYLDGNNRRLEATQVGQKAVQNLYTILEYFDSSDVQNLKVGGLSGKEDLVLKGLEATCKSIDDFLTYFPASEVEAMRIRIRKENDLNMKEFDPNLGSIVNMPTTV